MNKKLIWGLGYGALFTTMATGAFVVVKINRQNEIHQKQALIYRELLNTIDNFHGAIKQINASVSGLSFLQDELRKTKQSALSADEKIRRLETEAHSITGKDCLELQEALEKTSKYFQGVATLANLGITTETLDAKANTMLERIRGFRAKAELFGSPDEGDTKEIIAKLDKLVKNYTRAEGSRGPSSPAIGRLLPPSETAGSYWVNPSYYPYRDKIRSIAARYSAGRMVLAKVLAHFDRGQFSGRDRDEWFNQLTLRRGLIGELENLDDEIPAIDTVYRQHHNLLKRMLEQACDSMERFGNETSRANRQYLSQISTENSRIMAKLKVFYGIR